MAHTITAEQDIIEALNMRASVWANRIMTNKLSNELCKAEIAKQIGGQNIYDPMDDRIIPEVQDMQARVRKYLNAGLVTEATFKTAAQEQIQRIRQQANKPPAAAQSTTGSKDGLWSKKLAGKK